MSGSFSSPQTIAAILVRNRSTGHTVQRIAKAETIASPDFQTWLANQNASGSDVFMGMNPIQGRRSQPDEGKHKGYLRHVYLDLDRKGDEALESDSKFAFSAQRQTLSFRYLCPVSTRSYGK